MEENERTWMNQSDPDKIRTSYSLQTLSRVQTVLRAVKQTEDLSRRLQTQIEASLCEAKKKHSKHSEWEQLHLRRQKLQDECEWRTKKLQAEKELYDAVQTGNLQRDRNLKSKCDVLKKDRSRLHEKKKIYFSVREELIKNGAQLVMRRKQLISELAFIYPIREVSSNIFTIASIALPNAEQFQGCNDVLIEVAMGYTCHLVQMVSHFLDMPLRYMMKHCGSKSIVYDYILEKLNDKDREFVLSSRGHEKFQFDYGVYLLNKNIAQLRYYCGLGTTDLRLTLPNLKTLLQLRLGVNFDHLESLKHEVQVKSPKQQRPVQRSNDDCPAVDQALEPGTKQDNSHQQTPPSSKHPQHANNKKEEIFKASVDSFFDSAKAACVDPEVDQTDGQTLRSEQPLSAHWSGKNHTSNLTGSSLLDQLTKEKLLGPIANDEEIDVSSSEDSASAVYRSKLCPRLEENLTFSTIPRQGEESEVAQQFEHKQYGLECIAVENGCSDHGVSGSSDGECSDVEDVATFRSQAYTVGAVEPPQSASDPMEATPVQTSSPTEALHSQSSVTEGQVNTLTSSLDIHTDDMPTFDIHKQSP